MAFSGEVRDPVASMLWGMFRCPCVSPFAVEHHLFGCQQFSHGFSGVMQYGSLRVIVAEPPLPTRKASKSRLQARRTYRDFLERMGLGTTLPSIWT